MSYTLIGEHKKDARANRDGYIAAMTELMENDPTIVHVDCDLGGCINVGKLQAKFPDRVFNAGIAEQNAVGVASGMAAAGMKAFVHSFGCFAARRCFDQAFLAAGYSQVPVHIIGSDPGVTAAFNGATHMPFEDGALYMTVPGAVVIDSCDYVQTKSLTKKLAEYPKLSYMRLIRKNFKTIYADGSEFEIGKGVLLREGTDVTIVATGICVPEALEAAEKLAADGISAEVINIHTIKPLDEELIIKSAKKTGKVVTAEEHSIIGGLGGAVCEVLSEKAPTPVCRIGMNDIFGESGSAGALVAKYGLDAEGIYGKVKAFVK